MSQLVFLRAPIRATIPQISEALFQEHFPSLCGSLLTPVSHLCCICVSPLSLKLIICYIIICKSPLDACSPVNRLKDFWGIPTLSSSYALRSPGGFVSILLLPFCTTLLQSSLLFILLFSLYFGLYSTLSGFFMFSKPFF